MTEHPEGNPLGTETAEAPRVSMRTEILRAAADRELTPSQATELERHLATHPGDRRVIEFERELRASFGALATERAPGALRGRIAAMCGEVGADRPAIPFSQGRAWPEPRFSRRVQWLAIAASVAIVSGGAIVFLGQFERGPAAGALVTQQYRASLVSFIGAQHQECELHTDMIGVRFKTTKLEEVPGEFARVLGGVPDLGNIGSSGFRLLGAGPCAVPGRGKSVRMVLESTADAPAGGGHGALVSIHIQQDTGGLSLEPGRTYQLVEQVDAPGSAAPDIFVWRRDGFVYFLTSESESAMRMARAAFGVGEPSGTI